MKVITTKNPIMAQKGFWVPDDKRDRFYSAVTAKGVLDDSDAKEGERRAKENKRRLNIDKVLGAVDKGKQIISKGKDTVEFGKDVLGKGKPSKSGSTVSVKPTGTTDTQDKPMSITKTLLISVGVLVAVGTTVYFINKGKKGK